MLLPVRAVFACAPGAARAVRCAATFAHTQKKTIKQCEDLLSKSRHYDWKLRAIKTTLYVSGRMKRGAPELTEDKVLLRALRDFNLGKLTSDDTAIFLGLLNDLFPRTLELVPRAVEPDFEAKVCFFCFWFLVFFVVWCSLLGLTGPLLFWR